MFRHSTAARAKVLSTTFRRHVTSSPDVSPFSRWKTLRQTQESLHSRPDQASEDGEMRGWVQSLRTSKNVQFVDVVDGSRMGATQAIIPIDENSSPRLQELAHGMTVGSAVQLKGKWVATRKQAQGGGLLPMPTVKSHFELNVEDGHVVGECDGKTFPIQNKYHTPQFLRTIPHLRSKAALYGEAMRLRSDLINKFTSYFAEAEFSQVHPPIITSSDCEGAGEAFTIHPASKPNQLGEEYFSATKYLTVSSQLHLEAMAQGLGAVWALSPVFRAEDSDTGRHLSEFYMLEAELAFADKLDTIMDLTESCLVSVVSQLAKTTGEAWIERPWESGSNVRHMLGTAASGTSATIGTKEVAARRWHGITQQKTRWPRITYTDAIKLLSKHEGEFQHKPAWGSELQTEHEKFLAVEVGGSDKDLGYLPVFVTHYPRDLKAFYMAESPAADGSQGAEGPTVECFDLLLPDVGELVGGSLREHRFEPLAESMKRCGISHGPRMDWYLDLRRWGCPPHGGFGIGLDRLLSYLTTMPNIRDTAAFPRWPGRCDC